MATSKSKVTSTPDASGAWDPKWTTGDDGIHKERYTSPDFARMEAENLWPHVWQMACRIEEVARPGDYTVYEIVDQSILIIRQADDTIKAYHNVCPHRATALAVGSGRFSTGEITCPFHGWRWNLNGDNTFVLDRDEFKGGCLADEDVALRECQVATWVGCVFINMDLDAPSFEDHIAPIKDRIDPILIDQMGFYWKKSVEVDSNWKVAQEAFFEAYHVPGTHPQLGRAGLNGEPSQTQYTDYTAFANGHGTFQPIEGTSRYQRDGGGGNSKEDVERLIKRLKMSEEGMDAMVLLEDVQVGMTLRNKEIPEGSSVELEFMKAIYEHYKNRGRPIAPPEALRAVSEVFIFPNYLILPSYGNALIYRSRPVPGNPDKCTFELWSVRTYGTNETPPRPTTEYPADIYDNENYRLIPRQDFLNIPRMQKGFHSKGFEKSLLSGRQEHTISNMHKELDRYLKA